MPINYQKVISILLEEVDNAPERCKGYRDELKETLAEIVMSEREHREQRGNIQQQIDDKCSVTGRWLAENQS